MMDCYQRDKHACNVDRQILFFSFFQGNGLVLSWMKPKAKTMAQCRARHTLPVQTTMASLFDSHR